MRYFLFLIAIIAIGISCTPDQEKLTFDQSASLRFSSDSIKFDTLFTSVGSITKRLRVYNDSENAVEISDISLTGGSDSPYTIYVNGQGGSGFEKVKLFGEDSLLVLVEVTIDPADSDLPFLVTDEINFQTNGNLQEIKLVSWGQDAVFLNGEVLECNTTWTADRPYVITNSVLVDSLCNLTVEPGAKIYSHNGSFIFVEGTISVDGRSDNRVTFRNDRFDEGFEDAPGQWGGIIFLQGSKDNRIEFADIRNAEFGVYLGTPDDNEDYDLVIGNTRIENMGGTETFAGNIINLLPGYGILAVTSDLYVYNTLVNNCAINTVANLAGGNYRYENCTFANFSFDFFREDPVMVLSDNIQLGDNTLLVDNLKTTITNTIIWGSQTDELLVSNTGETQFSIEISHSLLRTSDSQWNVNNNILNDDPEFAGPRDYDYALDTLSPAKDAGVDIGLLEDLEGKVRDSQPDIGALERIEN